VAKDFDAVVVGSGFGGSVMAYRLADAGLRVCLLERGKRYPPGSFPRSPHDMARNFWDPSEGLHGLFDVWSFSRFEAIVSSGLGGGSLIYANVLLRKDRNWFVRQERRPGGYEYWPVTREQLDEHYHRVETMMGVQRYPFDQEPYRSTGKTLALKAAAAQLGLEWQLPPLAVSFAADPARPAVPGEPIGTPDDNLHHLPRSTCRLVGECDVGCNFGSKNSLDYTYLSAADRLGADIRTRCEVRSFEPIDGGFSVRYVEHRPEREGRRTDTHALPGVEVTATRLILSAGTLGTPYLLLRNRSALPHLSRTLGTRFSGNGDFLGLVFRARTSEHGRTGPRMLEPSFGPVITSAMRMPDALDGGTGRGLYIEDAGYPELVNWLIDDNSVTLAARLLRFVARRAWSTLTRSPKSSVGRQVGDALGKGLLTATSTPLLGMGRDVPDGRMRLRDGHLEVDWTAKASRDYFRRMNQTMRRVAGAMDGRYLSSPLWWLNLLITVHPLGGAPMGRDEHEGVVDSYGRVFNCPGLVVADGSVMPGPVGANPSLTIAALADRFADQLVEDWAQARATAGRGGGGGGR
jgi:cholesterol oxidase